METPDLIRASADTQTETPDLIRASTDTETETEPASQNHIICSYGDLILHLETPTAPTTYRVSTHQLCSASPVFKKFIPAYHYGRCSVGEASPLRATTQPASDGAEYELDINYEATLRVNPAVFRAMLNAIHGRPDELPETATYEYLLDLAEICDHYQCAEALAPWIEISMKSPELENLVLLPGYEEWLYIGCIFELQEVFGRVTQRLAKDVVKDDDGNIGFFVAGEVKQLPRFRNTSLPEDIEAQRAKALEAILLVCRQIYDAYHDNKTVKCKHGQQHCDNIVFAYLHLELEQLGLLQTDFMHVRRSTYEKKPLVSFIETFATLWGSIQHNLALVTIADQSHSGCVEPPMEKVKIFDPCLEGIAQLPVEDYRSTLRPYSFGRSRIPSGPSTWDNVLDQNTGNNDTARGSAGKCITICAFGDLDIDFRSIETVFRVSSHVVRTASRFLHRLIERFHRLKTTRGQLMDFDHDNFQNVRNSLRIYDKRNPKTVAVFFFALHGQGKRIPDDITFSHLYELAVLSDTFQCAQALRPWFCHWMDKLGPETANWDFDNLLYIAWVFEFDSIFQSLTRTLITKAFQGAGRLLTIDNDSRRIELCPPIPQPLAWKISRVIRDAITEITATCQELYDHYRNSESNPCIVWGTTSQGKVCSRLIFAELYRGLASINFLKMRNYISIPQNISLQTIAQDLDKVLRVVIEVPEAARLRDPLSSESHSACIQPVRVSNDKIQLISLEKKLDSAMCAQIREEIARRSTDDSDY